MIVKFFCSHYFALVEAQAAEVLTIYLAGWVTATVLLSVLRIAGAYINRGMSEKQTTTAPKCLTETRCCHQWKGWTGLRVSPRTGLRVSPRWEKAGAPSCREQVRDSQSPTELQQGLCVITAQPWSLAPGQRWQQTVAARTTGFEWHPSRCTGHGRAGHCSTQCWAKLNCARHCRSSRSTGLFPCVRTGVCLMGHTGTTNLNSAPSAREPLGLDWWEIVRKGWGLNCAEPNRIPSPFRVTKLNPLYNVDPRILFLVPTAGNLLF